MRGEQEPQVSMLAFIDLETRVPLDHPLRTIKRLADDAFAELSTAFDQMYAASGRPSIPPERLLKALLLIDLYSVRSERALCEQLDYDLLFRWFLGMNMIERASTRASSAKTVSGCWNITWRSSSLTRLCWPPADLACCRTRTSRSTAR